MIFVMNDNVYYLCMKKTLCILVVNGKGINIIIIYSVQNCFKRSVVLYENKMNYFQFLFFFFNFSVLLFVAC